MKHFDLIFRPILVLSSGNALSYLVPAPAIHTAATPFFAFIPHATLLIPYSQDFIVKLVQNSPIYSSLRHNPSH